MHKITEFVLKRPVTTFLVVVSLIFFGFMSITNQKMELMSDIEMPMMIVTTTYAGASPEDVDKLITKPIEDGVSVLSDVKEVTSRSAENYGMTIIQYEYGTDMDEAYDGYDQRRQPGSVRHHLGQLPGCAIASEYSDRHRKRQYDLPEGHRPRAARTGGQGGHRPL